MQETGSTAMPTVGFSAKRAAEQPTFGDTDDELGISENGESNTGSSSKPTVKRQKLKAKQQTSKRLFVASASSFHAVYEDLDSRGYSIAAWPLNNSIRLPSDVTLMPCHAYRNGTPCENLDVDERVATKAQKKKAKDDACGDDFQDGWDPGRADLAGIAIAAYEIADYILDDEDNAAVVVSELGGDATKLLVGCAAQAIRRIGTPEEAKKIFGSTIDHPAKPQFKKISTSFANWTRVTAQVEIMDHAL